MPNKEGGYAPNDAPLAATDVQAGRRSDSTARKIVAAARWLPFAAIRRQNAGEPFCGTRTSRRGNGCMSGCMA